MSRPRRCGRLLCLGIVAILAPRARAAPPADLALAEGQLASGRAGMALSTVLSVVEQRPTDARARMLQARSLAHLGQCHEALALFAELRGGPGWGAVALWDEARCHRYQGDAAAEGASLLEALALDPGDGAGWLALAALGDRQEDEGLASVARDRALAAGADAVALELLDARRAVRRGADDADALIFDLAARRHPQVALLDGLRWLDLGASEQGAQRLYEAVRADLRDLEAAAWRAEALRRIADLAQAEAALARPWIAHQEPTPLLLAVQARIAVDGGDLERAATLIEAHPWPRDAEALASRWYLERARGRPTGGLEARWRLAEPNPWRSLDQLVPR